MADDEIALKYTVPMSITYGRGVAMTQCVCGAMFRAEGFPDEIREAQNLLDAEHRDCVEPPPHEGIKTFWMSFCDGRRPEGSQFLGACVIDVTGEEANDAKIDVLLPFPFAQPDSEWIAAATAKAHRLGCNPGGEIAFVEVPRDHPVSAVYVRGVLMDRATIERIDREIKS